MNTSDSYIDWMGSHKPLLSCYIKTNHYVLDVCHLRLLLLHDGSALTILIVTKACQEIVYFPWENFYFALLIKGSFKVVFI